METLGLSEYVCNLDNSSSLDVAKKMVDRAWAQRDIIRAQQQKVMEDIPKQLELAMENLKDVIGKVRAE